MNYYKYIILTIISLMTFSCEGLQEENTGQPGDGDNGPENGICANFVSSMQAGVPQTLIVYGTSISSMEPNGPLWVNALGDELNRRYNNCLTLHNSGKSGQNSIWALENLQDSVIVKKPDAVIIEFATNDAVTRFNISLEDCRSNTLKIIETIHETLPDCEIILHTVCGYPLGKNLESRPTMKEYNAVYESIAKEFDYMYIDESGIFRHIAETRGEITLKKFSGDGVHPTERGALEIIYPNVLKSLTGDSEIIVNEDGDDAGITSAVKLNANTESVTKSTLNGLDIVWKNKDSFSLLNDSSCNGLMILSGEEGKSSGVFEGKMDKVLESGENYFAVYPYDYRITYSEDTGISAIFPDEQTNLYFPAIMAAYGTVDNNSCLTMDFKNIFSVLRLGITGNGEILSKITVAGNDNELMAGEFTLKDLISSEPAFQGNTRLISFLLDEPVTLDGTIMNFDIAIPYRLYEKGLTLTLYTEDGSSMSADIGTSGIDMKRNTIYDVPTLNFTPDQKDYEWSPGFLTVDEDGYRFTDTDRIGGKETIGMYFKYNSSYAVQADLSDPDYDYNKINAWYYDETSGKYVSKTMRWSEIPANDGGDPCGRVPVNDGESKWMTPTMEQWKSWAYKTVSYNAQISYNQEDPERGIYAVFDTNPDPEKEQAMYIFESKLIASAGGSANNQWTSMWIKSADIFAEGKILNYIQFKPSVASNSTNPAYKEYEIPGTLNSQGHQIRCIREVK